MFHFQRIVNTFIPSIMPVRQYEIIDCSVAIVETTGGPGQSLSTTFSRL